jgi:hypothetical protein
LAALVGCGPSVDGSADTAAEESTSAPTPASTSSEEAGSATSADTSGSVASDGSSTTGPDTEPLPDPPGVVWYRQYTAYSPGIEGIHVSAENAVTIAGGVLDSFKSVLPNAEEVDLVGEGSFVLRYEDDALAWAVHDGGRSNYLLEVLDDGAVVTVGNYVDAGRVFGEGSPQEVVLPSTVGDGMYVARYSDLGVLEWVLAASDGNPGATHAVIAPIGELSVLGFTNGGTQFQPDAATVDEGLFLARYSLDGLGMTLSPGPRSPSMLRRACSPTG